MVSTNIEKLLNDRGSVDASTGDFVVVEGGDLLDFEGKVVAVVSPKRGVVNLF
jgi:hypothetical protein